LSKQTLDIIKSVTRGDLLFGFGADGYAGYDQSKIDWIPGFLPIWDCPVGVELGDLRQSFLTHVFNLVSLILMLPM
jgi:hypothetical protein